MCFFLKQRIDFLALEIQKVWKKIELSYGKLPIVEDNKLKFGIRVYINKLRIWAKFQISSLNYLLSKIC